MISRLGKNPLITIAMPVKNCGSTIESAIHSILRQTYSNWELLVLDDGSSDDTVERANGFDDRRVRVLSDGDHLGLPARLNQAIDRANGPLIARMDGDDISYPHRLEKQVSLLRSRPDVDVVAAGILAVRSDGSIVGRQKFRGSTHAEITGTPWSGFHFNHGTWLGYSTWFSNYRYDANAYRAEDNELLLRSYRFSNFYMIPEILYAYRVDNLSLRKILPARYSLCKSLIREGIGGNWALLVGVPIQGIKAVADIIAITSGLMYRLLRHRAGSVRDTEVRAWKILWTTLLSQVSAARQHISG